MLFDELEKASDEVLRSLLNVLDSGRLTLAAGSRTLDFRNCLVFMTSNLGAREAWAYRERFARGWRRLLGLRPRGEAQVVEQALHRRFDPEFLNRIDRVLGFARIEQDQLAALLRIELAKLNQRLARRGVRLELDAAAERLLCRGQDARFGARDLVRRLRRELEPLLAEALLAQPGLEQLQVVGVDGQLQVRAVERD